MPKLKEFLRDLSRLTRKYKISISGCGCCSSPYLCKSEGVGSYTVEDGENNLRFGRTVK